MDERHGDDDPPLISSLRRAVDAVPADVPLRLHLAEQLLGLGRVDDAVAECAVALQHAPADPQARALMTRAVAGPSVAPQRSGTAVAGTAGPTAGRTTLPVADLSSADLSVADLSSADPSGADPSSADPSSADPSGGSPGASADPGQPRAQQPGSDAGASARADGFDWRAAEQDVGDVLPPMFVEDQDGVPDEQPGDLAAWDVERTTLSLGDVAGMEQVKERLELAFLAPMRNPDLRRLYGKSLRGGLLLYGPPGCGKTFVARAVAGELGARFIAVTLSDILDMWVGSSERNIHELFSLARRQAPCVVFLDEIDALGRKRSQTRASATRGAVTQLLAELDGVDGLNEGVFVLAATNHPWDVDEALRRPGRLDRTLLVLPPDPAAREGVFRHHLRDRPVAGIDLRRLAKLTDGYSGADIAHVCEGAAERALVDGVRTGTARMIGMADLEGVIREVGSSMGPWFDVARNVVLFADTDGSYGDLRAYLKKIKRL